MSSVRVREATEDDLPAILSLYAEAGLEESGFTVEEAREQLGIFSRYPYLRLFVAVSNEAIVGTFQLLIMDKLAKRGAKAGVVEAVAVDPGQQGLGIGRTMMEHAREQCRQHGCYKLSLSTNLKREQAHAFYEALGFARHGYSYVVDP